MKKRGKVRPDRRRPRLDASFAVVRAFRPCRGSRLILFHQGLDRGLHRRAVAFDRLLAGTGGVIGSAFLHVPSTEHDRSPPRGQQPSTLFGNFVAVRTEKRWRTHEKLGGSRFVRRSFSADKYEPSPYVCQACKHYILCLSFRSLARCGRLPSPAKSTDFLSED